MKRILFASVAALLFSVSAMAQTGTTTPPATDRKADMKDMRKDLTDIRKDRAERRKEIKEGDKDKARELTKDIKADKKDIKNDAKDLRGDGVKHPVKRAERQIHEAHEKRHG